jgi:tetratricopeptide (TPR) repeat protein
MALSLFPYMERIAPKDVHDRLVSAARRGIALDSTLAQPHVALGVSYWFDYSWDKAEAEFQTALRLDPRNVEALIQYARHLRFRGRLPQAMAELQAARAEDPMSAVVLSHLSYSYFLNQEMDSALKESGRAMEMDSTNTTTLGYRAMILLRANQPEEALKLVVQKAYATSYGGYVIGRVDPTAARRRILEMDAETTQSHNAETRRAMIYFGLGDTARALTALERATDVGDHWHASNGAFDPVFDAVRDSPRFRALLRRVGLAR